MQEEGSKPDEEMPKSGERGARKVGLRTWTSRVQSASRVQHMLPAKKILSYWLNRVPDCTFPSEITRDTSPACSQVTAPPEAKLKGWELVIDADALPPEDAILEYKECFNCSICLQLMAKPVNIAPCGTLQHCDMQQNFRHLMIHHQRRTFRSHIPLQHVGRSST